MEEDGWMDESIFRNSSLIISDNEGRKHNVKFCFCVVLFIIYFKFQELCKELLKTAKKQTSRETLEFLIYMHIEPTCTFTVFCGSWTCSSVASISRATTRPEVNLSGLSDSPVGSMIVAVARWIYQVSGKNHSCLCVCMIRGLTDNIFYSFFAILPGLIYLLYLFRKLELQQAALSQGCLENFYELHRFTG